MTYPQNKQMFVNGFVWERQEHRNGIDWFRYSDAVKLQGMLKKPKSSKVSISKISLLMTYLSNLAIALCLASVK